MTRKGVGLLILGPMKLGVDALHLVGKGALLTTERLCDLAVRDFRVVEAHLDDTVGIRIKLAETGDQALQQIAVSVDFFYRRLAVRDIIAECAIPIGERIVEGDSI